MGVYNIIKYFLRFTLLQVVITFITIWYFDKYLIGSYTEGYDIIVRNLQEDRLRFYDFIPYDFVKIDIYLALFVFIFLIILYSSNFYSYVNELSLTVNKGFFDEYLPIYLIWSSTYLSFLQIFRFTEISRGYLILFTFIVPTVLIIFRNTEAISRILGRNPTRETYLSFNLDKDSIFRELRIVKFRRNLFSYEEIYNTEEIEEIIESHNKESEINLIVIVKNEKLHFDKSFENYLLNLNKKILLISENEFNFSSIFLFRAQKIANNNIAYINNDIQYGSKYILKRVLDIVISLMALVLLFLLILLIYLYIGYLDGFPTVIKQNRVGLHGNHFNMYKFRTMKQGSHGDREVLQEENKHTGPLFKLENDPRIINGTNVLRKFSLDELPQFFNVLRGEMSVVGPRPLFEEDTQLFDKNYMRRLNVLPGITGLLQINERNTPDFSTWYKYDIEYIDNWSIYLDMKIILKTPFSLFKSKTKGL